MQKLASAAIEAADGIPQVLKLLLNVRLLHGDAMTITGQTLAEQLANVPDAPIRM